MRSFKKNNTSRGERWAMVEVPAVPDWEAAHIFLEVARCGSFRAAAQKLQQSVNALRRRVDALEQDLGVLLLIRHVNGVKLTGEGARIYNAAERMEGASFELLQAGNPSKKQVEGEVQLAVTEGLGVGWIMPQIPQFLHSNPKLTLNLKCKQTPPDLLRLEADISVQLERPKGPDLKVMKLGYLHMMFFASQSYIDLHGSPKSATELKNHRLVILTDDRGRWENAYQNALSGILPSEIVALRNNVSTAHFSSVVRGAGIGILPTYVQAIGADLVPLDMGEIIKHEIWLTYRSDAKRTARIRKTIDWIVRAFDPGRFPWFREDFIPPARFGEIYKGRPLTATLTAWGHPRAD
ncbi:MAG TPA: LysR family transcriptional regulator [Rhizomicrobium sp.]|nr:LysR family transcriptional regulator [Rhizomicrobium sp.]